MPLTRPGQAPDAVVGGRVLERRPLMGDPPPEVPRDRHGRPMVVPFVTDPNDPDKLVPYTRASTLGDALEDQYRLGLWKRRCAVLGTALNRSVQIAAKTCDLTADRDKLDELAELAHETAGGNEASRIGTAIHAMCDLHDRGLEVPEDDTLADCMAAYREAIARFQVHGIETFVVNDAWRSAGTFDRLVSPRWPMTAPDGTTVSPSDRLVWDLKTGQSSAFFGAKYAVQLGVYAGGHPYVHGEGRSVWPVTVPRQDWGLILHLPSGGDSAQLWWVDLSPQPVDLPAEPTLGEVALLVRDLRKRKYFHRAELPSEGVPAALDELGFQRLLRDAPSAARLVELIEPLKPQLTDAQLAAARARWAELSKPGPGAA